MKQLNEFLIVRLRDQDDVRNALRDTFTYLKLYLPQSVQLQINDSLAQLVAQTSAKVFDEEKLCKLQQQKLDTLTNVISFEKNRASKHQDNQVSFKDINEFMVKNAIFSKDKKNSKTLEDFFKDLIRQHIDDTKIRQTKAKLNSGNY